MERFKQIYLEHAKQMYNNHWLKGLNKMKKTDSVLVTPVKE
jgi:hypothetical protein